MSHDPYQAPTDVDPPKQTRVPLSVDEETRIGTTTLTFSLIVLAVVLFFVA